MRNLKINAVFLFVLLSNCLQAQVPQTMNFQGVLKDADGLPVNDTKFIEFRVYQNETGGTAIWAEQHLNVEITEGLFSVTLGETNPFPGTFYNSLGQPYLTFVVGGEEMSPRQQFNTVPYAFWSSNSYEAQFADEASMAFWAVDSDKLDGKSSEDFVEQDASGNATITGTMSANTFEGNGSALTNLPPTPDSDWSETGNYVYNLYDSIGIGTSIPGAPLDVHGHIYQSGIGCSVFLGYETGLNDDLSNNRNVFIGYQTAKANTSGYWNNIIGTQSFIKNETGRDNNAMGYRALYNNDEGGYNTAIGSSALYSTASGSYNLGLGYYAAYNNVTGENNIAIGTRAMYNNTAGSQNIAIGRYSSYSASSSYNSTIAIGDSALYDHGASSEGSIAIGQNAARQGAYRATVIGYNALIQNTTGNNLTAVGWMALRNNTTGDLNTAIGCGSMDANTIGQRNTATGNGSLGSNIDGGFNAAFGTYCLSYNVSGNDNSAFGDYTLFNATASRNSAFGSSSSAFITTGSYNSSLGVSSLSGNTEGEYNTAVGYRAYFSNYPINTTYDNSTAIGHYAPISYSNQVRIGNSSVTSIGGYTSWSNLSDGRFKQNVKENVPGLNFILELRPVTYHLDVNKLKDFQHIPDSVQNDTKLKKYADEKAAIQYTGFIAQEVEEVANRLGFDFSGVDKPQNEESHYSLRYAEFVVPLVQAIQEQQAIIDQQNELIQQLSGRIEKLEQKQ